MRFRIGIVGILLALLLTLCTWKREDHALTLPSLFCDNMVLQRNMQVPIWGTATPGDIITVTLLHRKKQATADATGKWMVKLDCMRAGGPYELTITSPAKAVILQNVLFGDVWVCSGQSNMLMSVSQVNNAEEEIKQSSDSMIRLFTVPKAVSSLPLFFISGNWSVCGPDTISKFSATGYFFGRELQQRLHVPVGLIHASWGGTPAEAWTSMRALEEVPELLPLVDRVKRIQAINTTVARQVYVKKLAEYNKRKYYADPGNTGEAHGWANTEVDTTGWTDVCEPGGWVRDKGEDIDGAVWFRKAVTLPDSWGGRDLSLCLGPIDDFEVTYFNGMRVGSTGEGNPKYWSIPRKYTIPGRIVHAGCNVIAVRVFDHFGRGGFVGSVDQMVLSLAGSSATSVSLAGDWKYRIEVAIKPPIHPAPPVGYNENIPTTLYNAMIAPVIPYGITGVIWYQGESNTERAYQYRTLFPTMIRNWRKDWGQGEFPFIYVQLANFMASNDQPVDSAWAELREAQRMTLALPKTGMVVSIDIGEEKDIHPKDKQNVGKRLELVAEHVAYGKSVVYSGPSYRSMSVDGNFIRLDFDYLGSGLIAKDGGELKGFAIAGDDRKFVRAQAKIDGETVVVSNDAVAHPVAVRYAWADNPECNLYNKEGLPASPFRTDDWPGITVDAK